MPNCVFSCQHHQKVPKKCQTMTYMPNTIFSCQATLKKEKFMEFGLQNCQPGNPVFFQLCSSVAIWYINIPNLKNLVYFQSAWYINC